MIAELILAHFGASKSVEKKQKAVADLCVLKLPIHTIEAEYKQLPKSTQKELLQYLLAHTKGKQGYKRKLFIKLSTIWKEEK